MSQEESDSSDTSSVSVSSEESEEEITGPYYTPNGIEFWRAVYDYDRTDRNWINDTDELEEEEASRFPNFIEPSEAHTQLPVPLERFTLQERLNLPARYLHTYAAEDVDTPEGAVEQFNQGTQVDEHELHPSVRNQVVTPTLQTPLEQEQQEVDYQTTFRERSDTLDHLADQLDQLLVIGSTSNSEQNNQQDDTISELNFNMAQPVATQTEIGKRQKMPDPEPYYEKRDKLTTWLTQINIKLTGDADHFNSPTAKIMYACGLLRGTAIEWAEPYINNIGTDNTIRFTSINDFKRKIKATLGDLDPAATAEEEIRNLRQGREECSTYFTKFSQHVHRLT